MVQKWVSPRYYTIDPNILIILHLGNPITFHQDYYYILSLQQVFTVLTVSQYDDRMLRRSTSAHIFLVFAIDTPELC